VDKGSNHIPVKDMVLFPSGDEGKIAHVVSLLSGKLIRSVKSPIILLKNYSRKG